MKRLHWTVETAAFLLLLSLFCGCIREEVEGQKVAFARREKKEYAPVKNHRLKLEITSKGQLYAGEGGQITFALINNGTKKVVIEEWYANDADNIVLICQNWLPGMTTYDPQSWVRLDVIPRKPAWRYPLTLGPGNRIFVTKKLPFVDSLTISRGGERRYFVKGELNLKSVRLESRVSSVSVRNAADKRPQRIQREKSRHFGR